MEATESRRVVLCGFDKCPRCVTVGGWDARCRVGGVDAEFLRYAPGVVKTLAKCLSING